MKISQFKLSFQETQILLRRKNKLKNKFCKQLNKINKIKNGKNEKKFIYLFLILFLYISHDFSFNKDFCKKSLRNLYY